MTVEECLNTGTRRFVLKKIDSARLDSIILAERVLKRDRAWLLANPNFKLNASQTIELNKLFKVRETHKPIPYITGQAEFYGTTFVVNDKVLVPRPETETMIELMLKLYESQLKSYISRSGEVSSVSVLDLGTGSGVIGITIKRLLPKLQVDLSDISVDALKVAKINVDKYTLSIRVLRSNLLEKLGKDYTVILCNLPYVPDKVKLNNAAAFEPRLAINAGPDGLIYYRELAQQLSKRIKKPLYILLEAFPSQHSEIQNIYNEIGYKVLEAKNFIVVLKLDSILR